MVLLLLLPSVMTGVSRCPWRRRSPAMLPSPEQQAVSTALPHSRRLDHAVQPVALKVLPSSGPVDSATPGGRNDFSQCSTQTARNRTHYPCLPRSLLRRERRRTECLYLCDLPWSPLLS